MNCATFDSEMQGFSDRSAQDPSPEVRDRARGALAAAATPAQVQRLLTACLPGGGARPQDVSGLLGGLLSSGTAASPTAWTFLQQ